MATINYAAREINVKIVYYGPALSGKTTNLQIIHKKTPDASKSDMVSLATEADRTLFFDFLPIDLGKIRGFSTKIQLYTVPGQVYYNATRKLVLRGVDGIVFVADSTPEKMDENIESLDNMEENLAEYGYNLDTIPVVLQFNKRDVPNALPIEELNQKLNRYQAGIAQATARDGGGVFETLKLIGKEVIDFLNQKYASPGSSSGMAGSTLPPLSQSQPQQQQQFAQPQQQQQFAQPQQQQQFAQSQQQQQFAQPQQQQQFAQPQQQQQFAQPQQQQQFAQPQQQQQFAQPQQQQQFAQPQQQQQFAQPQQQQQFAQPQQQQQFAQPQQQQQFAQPQQQQQFAQPQQQQQFALPQQQQQFAQPQQQQQFAQPQQQQQFAQPQQQQQPEVVSAPAATPSAEEISVDDAFELDFDTGAPEVKETQATQPQASAAPQSNFDDLVLDTDEPVASPTPVAPKPAAAPAASTDDLVLDSFTVEPLADAPVENSFDSNIASSSEEAVDVNSFFEDSPAALTPDETTNPTISITAIDEGSEDDDSGAFIFTTQDPDQVKGNKKKPINPKHKKNFLDNLFSK
jgi:signal recognition particle receptor subunit beta